MPTRRAFLRDCASAAIPFAVAVNVPQDGFTRIPSQGKSGGVAADTLAFPLNSTRKPVGPLDNDAGVIGIERQLRCACGCTLDVYTCRTTDFSCTYSPAMHAKVVEQVQQGSTPEQIIAWFLSQPDSVYGHKVMLMAPPARGFNVIGYVVPGLSVTAVGLVLVAWLMRKRTEPAPAVELPRAVPAPDAEQLARLRRALDEVDS